MLALIFLLILETSQDIMTLENGLIPTAGIRKSPKLEVNMELRKFFHIQFLKSRLE